jgi:hypothetical protein
MERRAFVRSLATGLPAVAGFAAGAAIKSRDYVKDASGPSLEALRKRVDELRERIDAVDASNKKLVKVAIALAGLSLGLDVTTLL